MTESKREQAERHIAEAAKEAVDKHADITKSFEYAEAKLAKSPDTKEIAQELARRGLLAAVHDARHAATDRRHNAHKRAKRDSGGYSHDAKASSMRSTVAIAAADEAWRLHVGDKKLWNVTGDELVEHEANERSTGDGHHKRADLFKRLSKRTKGDKKVCDVYTKKSLQRAHDDIFGG